jgi:hypothetical protein
MRCAPILGLSVSLLVAGCALPPEREATRLLPGDAPSMAYPNWIERARRQAAAANEAFYRNDWDDLTDAAESLVQTAGFLGKIDKVTDVPADHKDKLPVEVGALGKEARALLDAAKKKQVTEANQAMAHIQLMVRQLHSEPLVPPPPKP